MSRTLFALAVLLIYEPTCLIAQGPPRKNILIFSEVGETNPAIAMVAREITDGLSGDSRYQIEIHVESLDTTIHRTEASQREIGNWILRRYREQKPDVLVAVGPSPIAFLAGPARPIFPGAPIVFCGSLQEMAPASELDSRFTGTWLHVDVEKTIDAALRLFPQTRHIAVVSGSSTFDHGVLAVTRTELKIYDGKLDVIYLTDLSMGNLLGKLSQLPEHTIVLYDSFFSDAEGTPFVNATAALPMVANAANAPVFGMSDTYLGHGIVGGNLLSFVEQGAHRNAYYLCGAGRQEAR